MEGDEKTAVRFVEPTKIDVDIMFKDAELKFNSVHDEVILRILEDTIKSGESLKLAEKMIWDPKTKIAKFDVHDSTVLKLMYGKQLQK